MAHFSQRAILARRDRLSKTLNQVLPKGNLVLFFSGKPIQKPGGLDQTYPFLPIPEYYWLTGVRRFGAAVAYSQDTGFVDFENPILSDELLWEGGEENPYLNLGTSKTIAELPSWIKAANFNQVHSHGELFGSATPLNNNLLEVVNRERRMKDSEEVALIRQCAKIARPGYLKFIDNLRAGTTERHLQLAYESEILARGADKTPYDTIVGSGRNSAVLHATPTSKPIVSGENVLVDAGVDLADYCVDITRVFNVGGQMSSQQLALYKCVEVAQKKAMSLIKAGVPWKEIHLAAARSITESLVQMGVLKKKPIDELIDVGATGKFFVHGVGHMVGQRVRDVGGIAGLAPAQVGGIRLRVNIDLQAGHVMTVEPGVYFVERILKNPEVREKLKDFIDFNEAEKWLDIGGVRIEDDVLVTDSGFENLTEEIPYS